MAVLLGLGLILPAEPTCGQGLAPSQAKPSTEPPAEKPTERPTTAAHPEGDQAEPTTEPESRPAEPPRPLPGPKYLDLRYDEDFSYLDGPPGSYRKDFFDPIKYIHLDKDWRLTLGGEVRVRVEAETNRAFGAVEPAQDTFVLQRYLLHADLKYRDVFRLFAQGIAAFEDDRDLPPRPIDANEGDLHQLFADLRLLAERPNLTLRVGRQELSYGVERFVSPLDWVNVRRRFDGVKLLIRTDQWEVDTWWARPVQVQVQQRDHDDESLDFYGIYATFKGIAQHTLDLYFLAIDDQTDRLNPNGHRGDRNVYSLGSRFNGKTGGFDYDTELLGQWGHWADDTLQTWSWALDGGYTVESAAWKPRLGAGVDVATGDRNPNDGQVQTADQLYPLGHKYLGFIDLIGRQNITAANVNLAAWPLTNKVRTAAAWYMFWLTSDTDALYDVGGAPSRRDPTGRAGREVGQEFDLTVTWKLNVHSSVLLGYSHFWDGDFIHETGSSEDADLFYVQYSFKF